MQCVREVRNATRYCEACQHATVAHDSRRPARGRRCGFLQPLPECRVRRRSKVCAGYRDTLPGYGPCRHCLRDFKVGQESRILFTYDPFYELKLHPLPGPIFIHAEACPRFVDEGKFPEDLRSHRLTFAGYGAGRSLLCERLVEDGEVDRAIDEMLARPDVRFVHVRDTEAGCYDLRIEPAS